jgi:hypothetical protein
MPNSYSFGQPDERANADRLKDLRSTEQQVRSILATCHDPAFEDRFIERVRERRAGRSDRSQFVQIPDRRGGKTLAAVTRRQPELGEPGELLIHADDLEQYHNLLEEAGLVNPAGQEFVAELKNKVVRLGGLGLDPNELANRATDLRQQGVRISIHYMTPMGGAIKSVGSPELTAGPTPAWPMATDNLEETESSPIRVVIIDTGVYDVRDDGWLVGLETGDNREDLDDFPQDGFLDFAAGHGSFCAGIVQQIVPEAHLVVRKKLDSDGFAHELRVARELVVQVQEGLKAGQHVIVNLSLGTETVDDDERPVALEVALEIIDEESRQAGLETVVVAAAGNFCHERECYPAAFPTVTAVAALTQDLLPAAWSSRGDWVEVCTIGEGVRSTFVPGRESEDNDPHPERFPENAWALWSGTSFAAPQVAGAIAKIAIDEGVTPSEAKRRLLNGALAMPLYGKRVEILPHI